MIHLKKIINTNKDVIIYITLGIVTFYLAINFSKDWYNYQFDYETKYRAVEWQKHWSNIDFSKEPFYNFSSKAIGDFFGFSTYIFLSTILFLTIKLHYLRRITNSQYASLFFYICFYLFLFEGTQIRIAYATSLVMVALYCLKQKSFFSAFALILIASQFHLTAILFLVIFPLYYFKGLNNFIIITFLLSPFIILFNIPVLSPFKEFVGLLNPRYLNYIDQNLLAEQNSTGLFHYFIVFFTGVLLTSYYYLRSEIVRDRFLTSIFSIALLGIVFMCVFSKNVAVAARLGELFLVVIVILLTDLSKFFRLNNKNKCQVMLITISAFYCMARVVYLYPAIFN